MITATTTKRAEDGEGFRLGLPGGVSAATSR